MKLIEQRFNRIMTTSIYFPPVTNSNAFNMTTSDYSRARRFLDRDLLARLDAAANNNERHEILSSLKQDVLPELR